MTGQEHYEEAEKYLDTVEKAAVKDVPANTETLLRLAQVHATLALAGATAWPGWAASS